ncbi:MAG: type II secretion system GspH family protein [Muribaculum sp.]|nr:type II secretion system GspH family protein [Muribaculum sp.]
MKTKLFGRKLRKDKRGFSLVELLCAIGILATITTAIGSAMVVSSTTYKSGTEEVNLQKSAQFTANLIEELIVDATNSVDYDASTKTLEIQNTDYTHTIVLAGDVLQYSRKNVITGVTDSTSVLAEDVLDFVVDTSDFNESRNAQVRLKMKNGTKDLATVYNITSRNNPKSSTAVTFTQSATITCPATVVLEPGQGYELPITVNASGGAIGGFNFALLGQDDTTGTTATLDGNIIKLLVGANEKGSAHGGKMYVRVSTKAINPATGDPFQTRDIEIKIRRVTDFNMPTPTLVSGTAMKENAVYYVSAMPTGTNLDKVVGAGYEDGYVYDGTSVSAYVYPYTASWSFELESSTPGETWTDYVDVMHSDEDHSPYIQFRLKKDIAMGDGLTIVASSKHSRGEVGGVQYNRTKTNYGTVEKKQKLKMPSAYLAGEFLRGDDFVKLIELIDWNDIKNKYGGDRVWRDIRFCPAKLNEDGDVVALTGTWSEWQWFTTGDTPGFAPIRPGELNLNPALSYAIEVRLRYGKHDGTITWPKADTPESEYMFRFTVPAATVVFNGYYDHNWQYVTLPVGTSGFDYANRLQFRRDTMYTFDVTCAAGHLSKLYNNYMEYKLERQVDGSWVNASTEWGFMNEGGNGTDTGRMKLKAPGTTGVYRLELKWKEQWFINNWGSYAPYADESTGKGFIYFEVKN